MPSRREFIIAASGAGAACLGGCAALRPPSTGVTVKLMSFVAAERTASIVVSQDDKVVFQTEQTLPAANGNGSASETKIPDAFEAVQDEQFTVAITPASHATDTYDYTVRCATSET